MPSDLAASPVSPSSSPSAARSPPKSASKDSPSRRKKLTTLPLAGPDSDSLADPDGSPPKPSKKKNVSHIPCRFFKAGVCSAGKGCSFSHTLLEPGQAKPVCQYFLQGTCKFGHKCILAHAEPGQSPAFDRKNKRAAQLAARKAASQGIQPSVQELNRRASSGLSDMMARATIHGGFLPQASPSQAISAVNTASSANEWGESSSPALSSSSFRSPFAGQDYAPSPPSRNYLADLAATPPQQRAAFVDPRLRNTPSDLSFASPKQQHSSLVSAFGTSPFSAPGTRSIFLSAPHALDDDRPALSSRSLNDLESNGLSLSPTSNPADGIDIGGGGRRPALLSATAPTNNNFASNLIDGNDPDWNQSGGEDFLPSSLHELLTDVEIDRRRQRVASPPSRPRDSPSSPHQSSNNNNIARSASAQGAFSSFVLPSSPAAAAWAMTPNTIRHEALREHQPGASLPARAALSTTRIPPPPPPPPAPSSSINTSSFTPSRKATVGSPLAREPIWGPMPEELTPWESSNLSQNNHHLNNNHQNPLNNQQQHHQQQHQQHQQPQQQQQQQQQHPILSPDDDMWSNPRSANTPSSNVPKSAADLDDYHEERLFDMDV